MTIKTTISKETNYSLKNIEHYNSELNEKNSDIFNTYCMLLMEFLFLISEKMSFKNKDSNHFIIIRGLNTITNVFNNLLFYTKNLKLTASHVEKAYYYYTEFVEQITEEQHAFLQLTSRDASMYVYKKTILEINNETKKNIELSLNDSKNSTFKILLEFTKIVRIIIEKIITYDLKNFKNTNIMSLLNKLSKLNINEEVLKELNYILPIFNGNVSESNIYIEKLNEFINIVSNNRKLKNYYEKLLCEMD